MFDKRGQATIFIIMAILIVGVIAIAAVFYTDKSGDINNPNLDLPEVQEVKSYVDTCLKETAEGAILIIGEQGGYYDLPERSNYYTLFGKPYYMFEREMSVPTKDILERELSDYVKDNLAFCYSNFTDLQDQGYIIEAKEARAIVKISNDKVDVSLSQDVILSKGNVSSRLNKFSSTVQPVYLPKLLSLSNEIVIGESKKPETICITCIDDIANKYGVTIDIFETDVFDEYIFVVTHNDSNFTGRPYDYSFAVKYDFPECTDSKSCFNALQK